ncbi:MAG TPA: selenoneine biosynthesis selenosugar synthase SenB [Blastocatellia bacterium]|nr:selenoneine biosynthesis selenosugar synthase SenB [Blastocatellia bacterium]
MRIAIITPAPPKSRHGNRVTALRWAGILKELGHRVVVSQTYERGRYDLLVALHARRSRSSIVRFRRELAQTPIIVALTGTDLYGDLQDHAEALLSLEIASRIVILQPLGMEEIPARFHDRVRVIYQSVADGRDRADRIEPGPISGADSSRPSFDVCVIGHLRPVKDPFRAALASRLLPPSSRIRVLQVGGAMSDEMAAEARAEMQINPRYLWLDEQSRSGTRRILARSRLCILSSRSEGGANVLSEAIVASVPVVASRIPGTVGILGADYPGYFSVGDTPELAQCLIRAETDPNFLELLRSGGEQVRGLFEPARERRAWAELLDEIAVQRID